VKPLRHPRARTLLRPLAGVYGLLTALRNRFYDDPRRVHRASLPVLSVGNITVGGTGKTPLVAWLATGLQSDGRRPAVVSRGYGGTAGRGPLVVSVGQGPQVSADSCGDEPRMLAESLPGVVIVVGSDRRRGVEEARRLGADTVILDDGFQHRRLARDLDVVLLDASDPLGGNALLPAGRLREAAGGLVRAGVILVTRDPTKERFAEVERLARRYNPDAPILAAGHRRVGFFGPGGEPVPRPGRIVAFCGIGNPASFRSDLESEGCEILRFEARRDHHAYGAAELRDLGRAAGAAEATLVTTEKDLARLSERILPVETAGIVALRIAAVVYDPEPLHRSVARALERRELA